MKKALLPFLGIALITSALVGCGGGGSGGGESDVVMDEESEESALAGSEGEEDETPPNRVGAEGEEIPDEPETPVKPVIVLTERELKAQEEADIAVTESVVVESAMNSVLLGDIRKAVEDFHFDKGKLPTGVGELVKTGYLQAMPKLPAGKKVRINPKNLSVTLE